jgi:uncharacterized protein YegP (UPF0339 family)
MKVEIYKRPDDKWDWRAVVNGRIVATSGGQGYERSARAKQMAQKVLERGYEISSLAIVTEDG